MGKDLLLNTLILGVNLALDVGMVGMCLWYAYKFNQMRKTALEANRSFYAQFPDLKETLNEKLTHALIWVLILLLSIMAVAFTVVQYRWYVAIFSR